MRLLLLVVLACASLPLLGFAAVGLFSRYAADDYCTASQVVMAGFIQAQSHLYVNWSGRFSATFFNTLLEVMGVRAVALLPAIALLAWVTSAAWATRHIAMSFGWRLSALASATLAALLVFATLEATADLPQDVYWQTGLVTYLLPLILACLFVGWLARHQCSIQSWPRRALPCFVLALVAGGTSETFAAAQVTALTLATALALFVRSRRNTVLLAAGLVGALVALVIVALAPGNEVRQESSARTPLLLALPRALDFTLGWLRLTFARPHAIALGLLLAVCAFVAALTPRSSPPMSPRPLPTVAATARLRSPLLVVGALLGLAVTILACIFPAFYALGTNPPGRAQLIPEFLVMSGVAAAGWYVGALFALLIRSALRQRAIAAVGLVAVLALLVLGPVLTARRTLLDLGAAQTYAAQWDRLDSEIRADRARGMQSVNVPPLPSSGSVQNLDWLGPDPNDWFNQCVAGYYGVSSIAASPDG